MMRKRVGIVVLAAAVIGMTAGFPSLAMGETGKSTAQAQLVVTVEPGAHPAPLLKTNDIAVKLDNRPADVLNWRLVNGSDPGMQIIFLMDARSRSYLDRRLPSIERFIHALPPSTLVGVAFMENGSAVMVGHLTTDHAIASKALYAVVPNFSGSPYFCISHLSKHWPSQKPASSRVIVMLSDGSDPYNSSGVVADPFEEAAIEDAQKAGAIVYAVYVPEHDYEPLGGELRMQRLAMHTGGQFYALNDESPAMFDAFAGDLYQALSRQYLLTLATPKPGWQRVSVTSKLSSVKVAAPMAVFVAKK